MNSIGSIQLQQDVMWLNRILDPTSIESVGYTLGYRIHIQKFPILTRELLIGTVDDGDGVQGYFTYDQILQLRAYARASTTVTFTYEGEAVECIILESSLVGLSPLVKRPNPESDDLYFGYFKAIEI